MYETLLEKQLKLQERNVKKSFNNMTINKFNKKNNLSLIKLNLKSVLKSCSKTVTDNEQ